MQTLRTPDYDFAGLPEFPYAPRYVDVDNDEGGSLRVVWVEGGPDHADPILMLHGEPTLSFLYRRMLPYSGCRVADGLRGGDVTVGGAQVAQRDLRRVPPLGHLIENGRRPAITSPRTQPSS
jgi:hypothetical protein